MTSQPKLLFIDNFDSFTYNVVHLFAAQGAKLDVMLNDDARLRPEILADYDALLVGPGPGNPAQVPKALEFIRAAAERRMPVFGVCLGLQAIGEVFGARIGHAPHLMHGKTSRIEHDESGVFAGMPPNFVATRYHSLAIEPQSMPPQLRVTARSEDGAIQGLAHVELPIYGVQFHPESILSEHGDRIARNFLDITLAVNGSE
ncbi:MAG: aminodeoxychorismate/anthranilate synthase component II [Candidatus Baltobacteraceae bacterium]